MTDLIRIEASLEWEEIGNVSVSETGRLAMPDVPLGPGIYRFRISGNGCNEVYIGETISLRKRMFGNYASRHTGKTTVRIREHLMLRLNSGHLVNLDTACGCTLEVSGKQLEVNLADMSQRRLLENAALLSARELGQTILNL